jgi:type IV pilus assembly protein PilA
MKARKGEVAAAEAIVAQELAAWELGSPGGAPTQRVCPSATRSVPASLSYVSGRKYQSSSADWQVDAPNAGFACLKFQMDSPQYYMYSYAVTGSPGSATDGFRATANGDLNGDGVASTFTIEGRVSGGMLNVAPTIMELNPEE